MITDNDRRKSNPKALITKKRMQLKYFWITVSSVIVMMLIVTLSIYITFLYGIENMMKEMYDISKIKPVLIQMNYILIIETTIFVAFASWLSLRLSHRIAGPLYRIEKHIEEIIENGNLTEIKIRKKDELHDLVNTLNELIKYKMTNAPR